MKINILYLLIKLKKDDLLINYSSNSIKEWKYETSQ